MKLSKHTLQNSRTFEGTRTKNSRTFKSFGDLWQPGRGNLRLRPMAGVEITPEFLVVSRTS